MTGIDSVNWKLAASGGLQKMRVQQADTVDYFLRAGEQEVYLNDLLGHYLRLEFKQNIQCVYCGRKTKTSFNQGYCYPCFQSLAQCDRCIMSPELCHFAEGTCREPEWGETHCFQEHIVYLANSSSLKVGITRHTQLPVRWIDQGAVAALPLFAVSSRKLAGLLEVMLKQWLADKTNWRKMLKHEFDEIDLQQERIRILSLCEQPLRQLQEAHPGQINVISESDVQDFRYPSISWPKKISTFNLDKQPVAEGKLLAIKGQYLIFDSGCLNLRKFTAYDVDFYTQ